MQRKRKKYHSIKESSSIEPNMHSTTEKFPSKIYGTEGFIPVFTKASKQSQSWAT
jgi:hypothetical protein